MRFCLLLWLGLVNAALAEPLSHQRQAELQNMLNHDCGSCHGLPPKGGLGPSLLAPALADKSDQLLFDAIQNGRSGTPMPAWRPFLSPDEIRWIIGRLRQTVH